MKLRLSLVSLLVIVVLTFPLCSRAEDPAFPPLPERSSLHPFTKDEQERGLVKILSEMDISGHFDIGARSIKGTGTHKFRVRLYVISKNGIEEARRQVLNNSRGGSIKNLTARTVAPDGTVYEVDPDRDIVKLDARLAKGKTADILTAVMFPHVEEGSILDLKYEIETHHMAVMQMIPLQSDIPIRKLKIEVKGKIARHLALVPIFFGQTPAHTYASLDNQLNLSMEIDNLEGIPDESSAPPETRTRYYLVLGTVRVEKWKDVFSEAEIGKYAAIFGKPSHVKTLSGQSIIREQIDRKNSPVALDELFLQKPDTLSGLSDKGSSGWLEHGMEWFDKNGAKLMEAAPVLKEGDTADSIAPSSLPLKERVAKLVAYERKIRKPVLWRPLRNKLRAELQYKHGTKMDLDFQLLKLFKAAGIRARLVYAFSRYSLPLLPGLGTLLPYDNAILIEVSSPGEKTFYIMPGNAYAPENIMPEKFLGALTLIQPDTPGDRWKFGRIPPDIEIRGSTLVSCSANLPVDSDKVLLSVNTKIEEAAGYDVLQDLIHFPQSGENKYYEAWMRLWTGQKLEGDVPDLYKLINDGIPLKFDLKGKWESVGRKIVDRMLIPAFPNAKLFSNPFRKEKRALPFWLDGGHFELLMTWQLPEGWKTGDLPQPSEGEWPGGLKFKVSYTNQLDAEKNPQMEIVSKVAVDIPYMLPASSYDDVNAFYHALERIGKQELLVQQSSGYEKKEEKPESLKVGTEPDK